MALGAQRQTLISMFVRHGLLLTGVGIACGLVASFAVMRLMSSLLFNVSPLDPVTYSAVTIVVVITALPTRRNNRPRRRLARGIERHFTNVKPCGTRCGNTYA
jgi:ABC-type antimicrobial peptide transport system permease subunit